MSAAIEIQRLADADLLANQAAVRFVDAARDAVAARGRFLLALAGGSTPRRLYERLASRPWIEQVDWSRVEFCWGDERNVSPQSADANYRMAHEALLSRLPLEPRQIHRMPAERADLATAAEEYAQQLAALCHAAPNSMPVFDLVLLGMGADGHTASLFPGTAALEVTDRSVVANAVPQLGTHRLTLTFPAINAARLVMFLVAGAEKAQRLTEVLPPPGIQGRWPASMVRPTTGHLVWLVDQQAASRLPASQTCGAGAGPQSAAPSGPPAAT